jgi:hypothetical protein
MTSGNCTSCPDDLQIDGTGCTLNDAVINGNNHLLLAIVTAFAVIATIF